jgi:hypothetical protein
MMEYKTTIDHEKEVIMVKVWGALTVETVKALTTNVGAAAEKHGLVRFLFDVREATEKASNRDAFSLAENPEERGLKRHYKRAIVHKGPMLSYGVFETVSVDRGYIVKTFTDMDMALTWLQGNEDR